MGSRASVEFVVQNPSSVALDSTGRSNHGHNGIAGLSASNILIR
jgi:hypothetical protein